MPPNTAGWDPQHIFSCYHGSYTTVLVIMAKRSNSATLPALMILRKGGMILKKTPYTTVIYKPRLL